MFIGDGPERPGAETLCRELGISEHVRFVGRQEQMEDILAVGDLFLLTSEYESFGLAALEAMAAGVPVVSTNAGGLPEIAVEGKTGYLSEVGDIEDMSRHAIDILQDDARLAEFKRNAAAHAKKIRHEYHRPGIRGAVQPLPGRSLRQVSHLFWHPGAPSGRPRPAPPYRCNQRSGSSQRILSSDNQNSSWPPSDTRPRI